MKPIQLASRGTLQRLRQAAEQAWVNRDLTQCVELLERASRLDPADAGLLLQLGRMHGVRYDYQAAERCFEKALRISPKKGEALAAITQQARDFYNTQLSEQYLQRAILEKDISPEALIKLADVYERSRRPDNAAALIDRALQAAPGHGPALLVRARLLQRGGRLEEAESILRAFPENVEPDIRAKAWYELGAVLDKQGRCDEAMEAFLKAKTLARQNAGPFIDNLRRVRKHVADLRDHLTADNLQRWSIAGAELQPARRLILLCGHPRSGTTLLEQVLDSHPEMASAEETSHFMDYAFAPLQRPHPVGTPILHVLDSARMDQLLVGRNGYFRASELCLGKPIEHRLLVDKNPSLTFMIPALVRFFPEIRFLAALRDPRDVCLSCFMQPFVPVQQGSVAYLSMESTANEYVELMSMWRTVAPLLDGRFLQVRYEDMVEDLEAVARKTLAFLGVDWDERVLGFDEHARRKVVRSPTYADVTQKVFKRAVGRWRRYEKYLAPHLEKLAPFAEAFGYDPA